MKYLPLRSFESVTTSLNFTTPDCRIRGSCDLYTTKAAGADKKLYKNIETSLESQYESMLRLSASLSPPQAKSFAESMNLSRSSPFGPLSQISSRRTFAYLIATLNASHPDYDFSQTLRPTDFQRERSYKPAMNAINSTLETLRPGFTTVTQANTAQPSATRMWAAIDKEMDLKQCATYCYSPEEDPFIDEDGALWSMSFFFFNKQRRRVCYLYIRGISRLLSPTSSALPTPAPTPKRKHSAKQSLDIGAQKRAKYWLGDRFDYVEDDDDDYLALPDTDVGAPEDDTYLIEKGMDSPVTTTTGITSDDEANSREREKSAPRAVSEDAVEGMDV